MLATLALLLTSALPREAQAPAQDPAAPPAVQGPARRDPLKRFAGLDLTADQKDRLRSIQAKGAGDRRERRKAMMAVLTPDQRRRLRERRKAAAR